MTAVADVVRAEQVYFDEAWEARERKRATLADAPQQSAGPRAGASAVRRAVERQLASVAGPDEAVAFGRFDTSDGEVAYIGKHLISDSNRDPLVINWQAPHAESYFTATYNNPQGLVLRRKFDTERNNVVRIEEVLFADLAARVEELSGLERTGLDDTVLRDLDQDRTGEMQDIVRTIHASQYELVRSPLDQLLIIQGGPGTGKTVVALHRVSWLLYNHRLSMNPTDVLVIGPNPTFTKYIKAVLPGLGDNDVVHRDMRGLGPQVGSGRAEDSETARLKGDARMAGLLATALRQRIRVPEKWDLSDTGAARLTVRDLNALMVRFASQPYVQGRASFRTQLAQQITISSSSDLTLAQQIENVVERLWPSLTPQSFLRDLLGSRERLVAAAGDNFLAGDVGRLLRPPHERLAMETWSDADVGLLDEADDLMHGRTTRYAQVVVDEAQDLSPMQLRSIRRRSERGSMTLVGDIAQSTGPWARDSWDDIATVLRQDFPLQVEQLRLGYRVPAQVFGLAAQLLPEAAPDVLMPTVVRRGPAEPQLELVDEDDLVRRAVAIAQDRAGMGLFVGVICPDSLRAALIAELSARGVAFSDASRGSIGKSINLVSPVEAKGLEFDAVVVVEPDRIVAESERGLRMLYIAFTRTTRFLAVVHTGRVLPLTASAPPTVDLPPAIAEIPAGRSVPSTVATESSGAQENRPGVRPATAESAPTPRAAQARSGLSEAVLAVAVSSLAQEIRDGVSPALWPRLLDLLRRDLGVSGEDCLDLLD